MQFKQTLAKTTLYSFSRLLQFLKLLISHRVIKNIFYGKAGNTRPERFHSQFFQNKTFQPSAYGQEV